MVHYYYCWNVIIKLAVSRLYDCPILSYEYTLSSGDCTGNLLASVCTNMSWLLSAMVGTGFLTHKLWGGIPRKLPADKADFYFYPNQVKSRNLLLLNLYVLGQQQNPIFLARRTLILRRWDHRRKLLWRNASRCVIYMLVHSVRVKNLNNV